MEFEASKQIRIVFIVGLLALLGICAIPGFAVAPAVQPLKDGQMITIWPGVAPGSEGLTFKEEVIERSKEPEKIKDRVAVKVINPSLTVYLPEKPNGSAILVIPGGSYQRVVLDKEAAELAPWLKSIGVTFFVLRYRLPGDGHQQRADVPLQDAQRAIRLIRQNAAAWSLDPKRIGVMGFSAGGHVASSLAVKFNQKAYKPYDAVDEVNARPDFLVLGYPVISMQDGIVHSGSRKELLGTEPTQQQKDAYSNELLITKETPPAFIMCADNDNSVPVQNSIDFYRGMLKAGVSAELHIFKDGGHGYSIRFTIGKTVEKWTMLCSEWLKANGVVK